MFHRLFYISVANDQISLTEPALETMCSRARRRNSELEITGALIFCGQYFAQILEGPPISISTVMNSIACDTRHHDLKVIAEGNVDIRDFASWSLAFSKPSYYVERHIVDALGHVADDVTKKGIQTLGRFMVEMAYRT